MFPLVEEKDRTEYPFPVVGPGMEPREPSSSSSDTLPSAPARSRSSHSRSQRSTPSPAPRQPRSHTPHERDREYNGGKSRLLSRLIPRDDRDINHVRTMLVITSDRLESETRRANEAEDRVVDTLQRLRQAREATMLAQADAARANEELRLYKVRVEEAQREIFRAQDIINQLEQDRVDAEAEAARARTLARKFREERVVAKALEQGRREGFEEGLSRGREMGYREARNANGRAEQGRYRRSPVAAEDMIDEDEQDDDEVERDDDASGSQPEEIVPIPRSPPQPAWRPPSRDATESRVSQRSPPKNIQNSILSRIASPSPIRPPSRPSVSQTPEPLPVPDPSSSRSKSRNGHPIVPILVHNAVPTPTHPPIEVPPDNYIPYMSSDNIIAMPPPHELQRAPSPSPSPPVPETASAAHARQTAYAPSVRSRDFAYAHGTVPVQPSHLGPNVLFSPQSRTSTNISQYDLVSSRGGRSTAGSSSKTAAADALAGLRQVIDSPRQSNAGHARSKTPGPGRSAREDWGTMSSRGPRLREGLQIQTQATEPERTDSPTGRRRSSSAGSPLERLFKKRFRSRNSAASTVPDIMVESPSDGTRSHPTSAGDVNQPHLLSPEFAQQSLPSLDNMITDSVAADQRPLPPLPDLNLASPGVIPVSDGQLPAGFMPFSASTSVTEDSVSGVGEGEYAPDVVMTSSQKARSPKTPGYEVAPIPAGVVYPDPPGRGSTPFAASGVPLPPSPSTTPSPRRRRGSQGGSLSPLSLFTLHRVHD